ncbi:Tox-REase-5 domain-containing protein [Acinetobacter calcoaceticus]|uniref:Tox-REase-5 domain-containing protein n=1 Tax=Acinetobacter calcoaceticus TaxID=471 RepID=UPI001E28B416|nr:Tox-REase-5 domain-containing protein [Acinetobacter calcoaceticus]UGQ27242.1 restriction endonuclease fold toxin 5 domain-containing protein [Acinetobacter calcoaceticus]
MWGLIARGLATAGARVAAPAAGEVVATQGGRVIATEAAKGMATIVLAKEVSKDITKQQRCNKCEPYQLGVKHQLKRPMGNEINTEYQLKIANLSSYPLTFRASAPYLVSGNKKETTDIQEWFVNGVSFDGLWPMECILVEAKGRYAQFLEGKPEFMKRNIFNKMRLEAASQKTVKDSLKTAKLSWYFYERETKTYFDRLTRNMVTTIFMPL